MRRSDANVDPLAGLGAPRAPEGLEERVLRSTRQAIAQPPAAGIWVRLWESRPLRLAWAATAIALAAGNLLVAPAHPTRPSPTPGDSAGARPQEGANELRGILGLERLDASARPLVGALGASAHEPPRLAPPAPTPKAGKENTT